MPSPNPPDADGRIVPPRIDDPQARLYALLAVEVKPGMIAYYHLELDPTPGACTIDMERDATEVISQADVLSPIRPAGPWHIDATISGIVVSDRPDYRPPTRTPSRIDEHALDGITRAIPSPPGGPQ